MTENKEDNYVLSYILGDKTSRCESFYFVFYLGLASIMLLVFFILSIDSVSRAFELYFGSFSMAVKITILFSIFILTKYLFDEWMKDSEDEA